MVLCSGQCRAGPGFFLFLIQGESRASRWLNDNERPSAILGGCTSLEDGLLQCSSSRDFSTITNSGYMCDAELSAGSFYQKEEWPVGATGYSNVYFQIICYVTLRIHKAHNIWMLSALAVTSPILQTHLQECAVSWQFGDASLQLPQYRPTSTHRDIRDSFQSQRLVFLGLLQFILFTSAGLSSSQIIYRLHPHSCTERDSHTDQRCLPHVPQRWNARPGGLRQRLEPEEKHNSTALSLVSPSQLCPTIRRRA